MKHWSMFVAFCQQELAAGGPDPQMSVIGHLAHAQDLTERVWLIGCYGAHHCIPSAYMVWKHWRPERVQDHPIKFRAWLQKHWDALPVRPEMRSHRMVEKRARCLGDFAHLACQWDPQGFETYDDAWHGSQADVTFYGRYMAIKVIEMWRRFADAKHLVLLDMRAKGGWSPRKCLAYLWGDQAPDVLMDRKDESVAALEVVEHYFARTRKKLRKEGVIVSCFQLQVLLCEFREAMDGSYYSGASLDEELKYITQARTMFDAAELKPIFRARKHLFRRQFLGEFGGWDGPRMDMYQPFKYQEATHVP